MMGANIIVIDGVFGSYSVQILDSLGRKVTATHELIGVRRKYMAKRACSDAITFVFPRRDSPLSTNSDSNKHAYVTGFDLRMFMFRGHGSALSTNMIATIHMWHGLSAFPAFGIDYHACVHLVENRHSLATLARVTVVTTIT